MGGETATVAHWFDDVFLFEQVPGGRWAVVVAVVACSIIVHRLLKQRRRREQLRRRRMIRARLHNGEMYNGIEARPVPNGAAPTRIEAPPGWEIDLTEPGFEIDLRDGAVYGSEITLESGDRVETGVVGPFPAD